MGDELQLWNGLDSSAIETDRSQSLDGEVAGSTGLAEPLDSNGVDGELRRAQELVALYEASQEAQKNNLDTSAYDLQGLHAVEETEPFLELLEAQEPSEQPQSLIVIDQGVSDWRDLVVSAPQEAEILVLEEGLDGVKQISDYLTGYTQEGGKPFASMALIDKNGSELATQLARQEEPRSEKTFTHIWDAAFTNEAELNIFERGLRQKDKDPSTETTTEDKTSGNLDSRDSHPIRTDPEDKQNRDSAVQKEFTRTVEISSDTEDNHPGEQKQTANGEGSEAEINSNTKTLEATGQALNNQRGFPSQSAQNDATPVATARIPNEEELVFYLRTDNLSAEEEILATKVITLATDRVTDSTASGLINSVLIDAFSGSSAERTDNLATPKPKRHELQDNNANITIEIRESEELMWIKGAYINGNEDGNQRIIINREALRWESESELERIVLEEIGHALDARLNSKDSEGDEGERFTSLMLNGEADASTYSQNDHVTLNLDGVQLKAETATFTFSNAYQVANTADKETNIHEFDYNQPLTTATIDSDDSSASFSGNDVAVIGINIGGTDYYGWVSRPIKSQGRIQGFYMWLDTQWGSITDATNDGYKDTDGTADNIGFILVVNQSYFDGLTANVVGGTDIRSTGSSSDRVDSALNALLPDNSSPTAVADQGTAQEAGGINNGTPGYTATGDVLSNDTDLDGDSLTVTKAGTSIADTSISSGSSGSTISGNYGDLTINQDGTYTYIVTESLSEVQRLRTTSNTLEDSFVYELSDGTTTANATLTITIEGQNDNPDAFDDYNVAKESLLSDADGDQYTSADPLGKKAIGNVLENDSDVDGYSESETVSGITGTATGSTDGTTTTATFATSSGFSSIDVGDYVYAKVGGSYYPAYDQYGAQLILTGEDEANLQLTFSGTYSEALTIDSSGNPIPLTNGSVLGFNSRAGSTQGNVKDATYTTSTVSTPSDATTNLSSITGTIAIGMTVSGSGIATGTTVTDVTYDGSGNITNIELSNNASVTSTDLTFSAIPGTTLTGRYGTLVLSADGAYTYKPFANNTDLAAGQTVTEAFSYLVSDSLGATDSAVLYIDVVGSGSSDTNAVSDSPSAAAEAGGTGNSSGGSNTSGNVLSNDSDPDSEALSVLNIRKSSDSSFTSVASGTTSTTGTEITGSYGKIKIGSDGTFTYTVSQTNANVETLQTGESVTETFTYEATTSTGGSGYAQITITVTGANDAPIASNDSATARELNEYGAPGINPTGNVLNNDSDQDNEKSELSVTSVRTGSTEGSGTSGVLGQQLAGTYGFLTLNADGSWSYIVDNTNATVNALNSTSLPIVDSFNYTLSDNQSGDSLGDIAVLSISITGVDDGVEIGDITVNEASPYAIFSIYGSAGQSVSLSLSDGTATVEDGVSPVNTDGTEDYKPGIQYWDGTDWQNYDGTSASINSDGTLFVRTELINDSLYEGSHTYELAINAGGSVYSGLATIVDDGTGEIYTGTIGTSSGVVGPIVDTVTAKDDDRPDFSIDDVSVNEAAGTMTFTVTKSGSTNLSSSVAYSFSDGTATSSGSGDSNDYSATADTLSFAAGDTSKTITVTINDDSVYEGSESFNVNLANATNASISDSLGVGTIIDDELSNTTPVANDDSVAVTEGQASTITNLISGSGEATADSDPDSGDTLSITHVTVGSTTTALSSLSALTSGTYQGYFQISGQDGSTIYIKSSGEMIYLQGGAENTSESFSYTLFDGTTTDTATVTLNVTNANDAPTISVSANDFTEDGSHSAGDTVATYTTTDQDGDAVTVTWSSGSSPTDGSGNALYNLDTANNKVTLTSDGLAFLKAGNDLPAVNLTVTDPSSATGTGSGDPELISIQSLTVPSSKTVEGNNLVYTATLSGTSSNSALRFNLTIDSSSTADSSGDYTPTPTFSNGVTYDSTTGLITVPAGVSSFTISYPTQDDLVVEGTETVVLQLGTANAVGQITDGAGTFLSINDITVNEASPNAVFRVDGVEGQEIRLALEAYSSDADAATDNPGSTAAELAGAQADIGSTLEVFDGLGWQTYTAGSFVRFPTGSTTLLVRVAINNDSPYEGPEAFKLIAEGQAIDSTASDDTNLITVVGVGIIGDDSRGPVFNESGAEDPNAIKDDDRTLKVSNINVNEASTHGVFTVFQGGGSAITVHLSLTNQNQRDAKAGEGTFDINQVPEVWNGSNWEPYNSTTGITLQSNIPTYVRVDISDEADSAFEGAIGSESIGESFRLIVTPKGGSAAEYGIAQILDDGTGLIYTGAITSDGPETSQTGLDDDLDKDGLPPNVEEILATLSSSSGGGGSDGDLNNDGIADAEQSAVGTLAWITADRFDAALDGSLTEVRPIISLSALTSSANNAANANYQLEAVSVLDNGDANLDGGWRPLGGQIVDAPWDALKFGLTAIDSDPDGLDDADPTRAGTQVVLNIDISRAGMNEGDFNAYYKYVSATAIANYATQNIMLTDLDGNTITSAGWYDYTQRSTGGDGARFITSGGKITAIELVITDNTFGDNDPTVGEILDPGAPVKVQTAAPIAGGSGTSLLPASPAEEIDDSSNPDPDPTQTPAASDQTTPETTNDQGSQPEGESIPAPPRDNDQGVQPEDEPIPTSPQDSKTIRPAVDPNDSPILPKLPEQITTEIVREMPPAANDTNDPTFSNESGRGNAVTPLDGQRAQRARDALIAWARESGLVDLRISGAEQANDLSSEASERKATTQPEARQAPNSVLPTLGPNLLDALALGAVGLYITHQPGRKALQQRLRSWWKGWKPTPVPVVLAKHQHVVSVFLMQGGTQRPKLVAAELHNDCVELLVEQPLNLQAPAGSSWKVLNLQPALKAVMDALKNLKRDPYTLLLFDPTLQEELAHIKPLAQEWQALLHTRLQSTLLALNSTDVQLLSQWLNKPSSTNPRSTVACAQVMDELTQLQQHWSQFMPEAMANVAGVLELSIGLGNLTPSAALI